MNRRRLAVFLATAAAVASGCTTFTDNDAVARVGDTELSGTELEELVVASEGEGATTSDGLASASAARNAISGWILAQVGGDPAEAYARGFEEGGTLCLDVLVVEEARTADLIIAELRDGADFLTVFDEQNIDPGLPSPRLDCLPGAQIPVGQGIPFWDATTSLSADDPYTVGGLPNPAGEIEAFAVARFVPYDELDEVSRTAVANNQVIDPEAVADADVYIDPRYGAFDPQFGVVPLG